MFGLKFPFFIIHILILLWLCCNLLFGIYIFGTGFLLSRIEIYNQSFCDPIEGKTLGLGDYVLSACERTPCFSRAVVLIIDGLRYDFAQHDPTVDGPIYRNKMPIFQLLQESGRALLVPFIADPPTTTLQRLKGLTAGSLPTFIDAGANFFSDEIMEDNIIQQSVKHGKRIVFMGDDTWTALFPRHFHRKFPYPSFNVKDLHTVDNGIMQHLPEEMKIKDWDILIAHFLGVDHCGHRYGPMHTEMAAKLKQMNDIIENVANSLDNKTVLFVMGDHGMTKTGDHGGDSSAEVKSALFIYSKSRLIFRTRKEHDEVAQVDFVPTFSLLLGLPIPFSNLGSPIDELFEDCTKAFLENANQVSQFLNAYASVSSQFSTSALQELEESLKSTKALHARLPNEPQLLRSVCRGYAHYLKSVKEMCSATWAQFDISTMIHGIFLLTTIVFFLALWLFVANEVDVRILGLYISRGTCIGMFLCSILWLLRPLSLSNIHILGYSCTSSILLPLVYLLKSSFTLHSEDGRKKNVGSNLAIKEWIILKSSLNNFRNCFPTVVTVLYFFSCYSNSLVVNEDHVVALLCQSLVIVGTASCCVSSFINKGFRWKLGSEIVSSVVLLVCIRAGMMFFRCREEQQPCWDFFSPTDPGTLQSWHLLLATVCLVLPVLAVVMCLKRFSNSYDFSHLFVRYALSSIVLCIVAHWSVSRAPDRMLKKLLPGNQEIAAKVSVYLCLAVVAVIFLKPISSSSPLALDRFAQTLGFNLATVLVVVALCFYLLAGEKLAIGLGIVIFCGLLWAYLACHQDGSKGRDIRLGWRCTVVWAMLSSYGFFVTGHQAVFSTINWNAAFIVSDGNSTGKFLPAVAVILETFSSQILFALGLPLLPVVYILLARQRLLLPHQISDISSYRSFLPIWSSSRASHLEEALLHLQLSLLLFSGIKLLGNAWACTILRRHLMVWKIFAPRIVFEAVSCLVTIAATVFSHVITLRLSFNVCHYAIKNS